MLAELRQHVVPTARAVLVPDILRVVRHTMAEGTLIAPFALAIVRAPTWHWRSALPPLRFRPGVELAVALLGRDVNPVDAVAALFHEPPLVISLLLLPPLPCSG